MYRVLDLFSGIGGLSLGLERTGGFETVAFCEIEPYCRKVLKKHWPEVPCYEDIRTLTAEQLSRDGIRPNVICGGFPCQDISNAGKRAGIEGERSGLWSEYARLADELRPEYIIVENVAALLGRGLGRVLGDLAALGFDAEWHCIPASAIGAPHRRDRLWIVAYSHRNCESVVSINAKEICQANIPNPDGGCGWVQSERESERENTPIIKDDGAEKSMAHSADSPGPRFGQYSGKILSKQETNGLGGSGAFMAHPNSTGFSAFNGFGNSGQTRTRIFKGGELERAYSESGEEQWSIEPSVGRVANGVSGRVDRLRALGNAVVPQIPELLGRAILEHENQ